MAVGETKAYVELLGRPRARIGSGWLEFAADKRYQLLAYLAFAGDWVSRERLAYLLWSDDFAETSRHNLRQLLARLRKLSWLGGLEAQPHGLRWQVETDVALFKRALAANQLDAALSLYRGKLLTDLDSYEGTEFSGWLEIEREHLHANWREALLSRVRELEGEERYGEAAKLLRRLTGEDPLDEEAVAAYLHAASAAGEREQALRAYRGFAARLRDELGLEPTSATQNLAQAIQDRRLEPARLEPAAVATLAPASLPTPVTSFVGRDLELSEIAHLLLKPGCRLLTLTGPGGIGKTRIALKAAEELASYYPGGIRFVALEALTSPDLTVPSLAEALGVQGQDDPFKQVVQHIGKKRMLVILDNYEHLLKGAALVSRLLQLCPHLKLLVTSRERLNLAEEWLLPIEGLSFPATNSVAEEAFAFEAVTLFVQRAKQVSPGFAVDGDTLFALIAICKLLEGSPLAIELSAGWVRLMSCAEIAREIEGSLDFLSSRARNVSERHKSIRATFEYSWKLLGAAERRLLRRLSAFRGGFKKEAAAVVAGASVAVLASLVDKSLLRISPGGRYDLHPLLSQYIREKLAERPQKEALVGERHGKYYLHLLQGWQEEMAGPRASEALLVVEEELENIRAAWSWAVTKRRVKELEEAAAALQTFFNVRGRLPEGMALFAQAAAALDEHDPAHNGALGRILVSQAQFSSYADPPQRSAELAQAGLALLRPLDKAAITGHHILGSSAFHLGDYEQSKGHFEKALGLAQERQDRALSAGSRRGLAVVAQYLGDYQEAMKEAQEALSLYRGLGDRRGEAWSLGFMGLVGLRMGETQEGEVLLQRALQLAPEGGERHWIAIFLAQLGLAAYEREDYVRAQSLSLEALAMTQASGDEWFRVLLLADLGRIELALDDDARAEDRFMESLGTSLVRYWQAPMLSALVSLGELYVKRGQLEHALELSVMVLHHPATEHVHKERARRLLAKVQRRLSPEALAAGLERNQSRSLEDIAAEIVSRNRE